MKYLRIDWLGVLLITLLLNLLLTLGILLLLTLLNSLICIAGWALHSR